MAPPRQARTLVEQFLSGFVRIHVGFLKGDIDISIRMVPHDFLDGLNGFAHSCREQVSGTSATTLRFGTRDHCTQNPKRNATHKTKHNHSAEKTKLEANTAGKKRWVLW